MRRAAANAASMAQLTPGWVKDMSTPKINYDVKNIHVDSDSMYLCSYICTERIVRAC